MTTYQSSVTQCDRCGEERAGNRPEDWGTVSMAEIYPDGTDAVGALVGVNLDLCVPCSRAFIKFLAETDV